MKKATNLYKAILTLAVIVSLGGAMPACAADWHGHARQARDWHNRHWHNGRTVYDSGGYVTYAPPLVEPPPPVYYAQQPGINVVVPLNFR
jgi:hypothetical protein